MLLSARVAKRKHPPSLGQLEEGGSSTDSGVSTRWQIDPHAHEKHTVEIDPQVVEADGDQIRIPAASNEARPSGLRRAQTVVGSVTGRTYSTRDWSKERLCDVVM
eukprot:314635-Rhodomonas_salina.1